MNRLEAIISLVEKCDIIADIGCDHGYVVEMALKNGLCKRAIATDINKGPLNSAINYLTNIGLEHYVDFRLGGGLSVIEKEEVNGVIIAGMGGDLISDILENSRDVTDKLDYMVLQPMTHIERLRKYLSDNDFLITEERIVKEFYHYYFIMKVKKMANTDNSEKMKIDDEIYYSISKYLFENRDSLLLEYIKKHIEINEKIIKNISFSRKNNNSEKEQNINKKIEKLKWMVKQYEN